MRFKKGQIVWVNLEGSVGREQKGTSRPCIIVQNDAGNKHADTTIVVPLTRRIPKRLLPTHFVIQKNILGPKFTDSTVLTEQVKVIDTQRITRIEQKLPVSVLKKIDQKMLISLGISTFVS